MNKIHKFDNSAFFKKQGPFLIVVFVLSLLIDLCLIWKLTLELPEIEAINLEKYQILFNVYIFLLIINTLVFKFWNIFFFWNKHKKWNSSYIEINDERVLHCEEQRKISQRRIKFEQGYIPDETKQFFNYISIFKIKEVHKIEKLRLGNFKIHGIIEWDCLDEILGLEMGVEDRSIKMLSSHIIPPYYEDMGEILRSLK